MLPFPMMTSEDRSKPLVTCTGNPCQSTGTSSLVRTGNLAVLPVQVTNSPDRSSEVLITNECIEWKVSFGYQIFYNYMFDKKTKKKLKLPFSLNFLIKLQFSFQYHIFQNHIHTNPYLETHKSKLKPSNVYTVNSIIDATILEHS